MEDEKWISYFLKLGKCGNFMFFRSSKLCVGNLPNKLERSKQIRRSLLYEMLNIIPKDIDSLLQNQLKLYKYSPKNLIIFPNMSNTETRLFWKFEFATHIINYHRKFPSFSNNLVWINRSIRTVTSVGCTKQIWAPYLR